MQAVVVARAPGGRRSPAGVPWRAATGWPSTAARTSTSGPCSVDPRRADEDRAHRPAVDAGELRGPPRRSAAGARTRCARATMSMSPRWSRSSMISPAQVPKIGVPAAAKRAQRLGQALALDAERHRRRLAARASRARRGRRGPRACGPRAPRRRARAGRGRARRSRPAGRGRRRAAPRVTSRGRRAAAPRRACAPRATAIAGAEALATRARRARGRRSASWPRRSRAARVAGSADLKMPEPTNTASAPSCITSDASAGVAMPPAQNSGTGSLPSLGDAADEVERRAVLLGRRHELHLAQRAQALDLARDRAQVAHGLDDVAGAGLALGADHRRALADAPQRLAEVGRAAHERDLEGPLVDVVGLVGRASGPRTRRCSRPRAPRAPAPRRSGRCAPWP